jgi:vacuolar protein sorting-associated protein VTA1
LGNNEAITNDTIGYAHIENFALKIFISADNEDRTGNASKYYILIRKTAKTFLAASIFLELLKIFGELDQDVTLTDTRPFKR